MNAAVGLMDGLGLDGDRCICVIPRHPPFSMKEEALPACKLESSRQGSHMENLQAVNGGDLRGRPDP